MGTENGRNGTHRDPVVGESIASTRVGRRSVYLEVREWLRSWQWRGQKGRWGHIGPHGPYWCSRCHGSILSRGVVCPNVHFQMLILAAVWRIDWRNWDRKWGEQGEMTGIISSETWWSLGLRGWEWNGTKKADMGSCWEVRWNWQWIRFGGWGKGRCQGWLEVSGL